MKKDRAALDAVCALLKEDGTIDALAEYWLEEIYEQEEDDVKPCYQKLRDELKTGGGKPATPATAAPTPAADDADDDSEEESKKYKKWKVNEEALHKGPDRCRLGHALEQCTKTALLVLDEE